MQSISTSIIQTLVRFIAKLVSGLPTARLDYQDVLGPL